MTTPQIARVQRVWAFLGSAVRERREARGLTAEAVAGLADIHVSGLYAIEAGRTTPTASTLAKLCSVLDCAPTDLFICRDLSGE